MSDSGLLEVIDDLSHISSGVGVLRGGWFIGID